MVTNRGNVQSSKSAGRSEMRAILLRQSRLDIAGQLPKSLACQDGRSFAMRVAWVRLGGETSSSPDAWHDVSSCITYLGRGKSTSVRCLPTFLPPKNARVRKSRQLERNKKRKPSYNDHVNIVRRYESESCG